MECFVKVFAIRLCLAIRLLYWNSVDIVSYFPNCGRINKESGGKIVEKMFQPPNCNYRILVNGEVEIRTGERKYNINFSSDSNIICELYLPMFVFPCVTYLKPNMYNSYTFHVEYNKHILVGIPSCRHWLTWLTGLLVFIRYYYTATYIVDKIYVWSYS